MNKPRISILLTVFNSERFLGETIESVLAQSYEDWELLVEDGASTDRTVEIVRNYARACPKIKLVSERDESQAHAMAKAATRAAGDFIMILAASDGYLDHDWLSRCVAKMDEDPELSLVWGIPFEKDEGGRTIGPSYIYRQFVQKGELSIGSSKVATKVFQKIHPTDPGSWVRLAKKINMAKIHSLVSMMSSRKPPQKRDWFAYWLKTGMIFPDGNMCVARKAYFDCMPPYKKGSKDQIYWMDFFFNLNARGYLSYCIPVPANFARTAHEGQLGQRIAAFTEKNRANYFKTLARFQKDIATQAAKITFRDRAGSVI